MALPVVIPNTFANANASIPLSQLDNNFSTVAVAINGMANGAEALSNVNITGGSIANASLSNVSISSGNVTINVANVTTLDATNVEVTNIKAKDGTASATIADSTGVMTIASSVLTTADINGGTIDNAAIGATTPTTGAFTTVSASTSVTTPSVTNAGTLDLSATGANVTTFSTNGSERMRLDSSGNLGIGTSSPSQKLTVAVADAEQSTSFQATTGRIRFRPYVDATNGAILDATNTAESAYSTLTLIGSTLRLLGGGGSGAVIDSSGNVGIGTSSPGTKLTINGDQSILGGGYFALYESTNNNQWKLKNDTNNLTFTYNATEYLRVNNSGNVGIGTSSPGAKLDVAGNVFFGAGSTSAVYNRLWNGAGYTYFGVEGNAGGAIATGSSAYAAIISSASTQSIQLAPGGTVKATIDSSGNLGLGVTPSAWVAGAPAIQMQNGSLSSLSGPYGQVNLTSNAYASGNADIGYTTWRYARGATGDLGAAARYTMTGAGHAWFNAVGGIAGDAISFTQAMTLDASGNLGIGTTSPVGSNRKLEVGLASATTNYIRLNASSSGSALYESIASGTASAFFGVNATGSSISGITNGTFGIGSADAYALTFGTTNTERMRIDSSGNFLVGTTNNQGSGRISVIPTSSGDCCISTQDADTAYYVGAWYTSNTTLAGYISVSGNATSYVTSSDKRVKKNIVSAPDAGDKIDAMQVVSHDWKNDQGDSVEYGMIAQDLHKIAPQAVNAGDDGEEVEKTWGVDYSKLVPMLVKEIQSLRARVAQLESKGN